MPWLGLLPIQLGTHMHACMHAGSVMLWLGLLPIQLASSGLPPLAIAVCAATTSYIYLGIDELGVQVEQPFKIMTGLGSTGLDWTRLDSTRLDSTRLDSTRLDLS